MDHTAVERKIKKDVVKKNTLLKSIRVMNRKIEGWRLKSEQVHNRRWRKKYCDTAARFIEKLSTLRPVAQKLIEDLDVRIHEELKFSKEEFKDFKEQLKLEIKEMEKVARALEEAKKKLAEDKETPDSDRAEKKETAGKRKRMVKQDQAAAAKLKKKARKEEKKVEKLRREVASEEADKKLFERELKRMEGEKEALGKIPESSAEEADS